jgi:hypothetical protein
MERPPSTIPLRLPNGVVIRAETTPLTPVTRERDVARGPVLEPEEFSGVMGAVEGIASSLADTMERLRPSEASIEFGLELAVETGKLTALLVKGSSKANLKITLTWTRGGDAPDRAPRAEPG